MYMPTRNCIKISKNKCCKCYNYAHACSCYQKTHPYGKNKKKENSCFCHDYPGHFSSVCYANPCDPKNNCCKKQNHSCRNYKDNHDYNCCSQKHPQHHEHSCHHQEHYENNHKCCDREEKAKYDVKSNLGPGLISYNTYKYNHPVQHKDDYELINNEKHYKHRCRKKCKCKKHKCSKCKSYYYKDDKNEKACPNCRKKEPNFCKKCNFKYIPNERWHNQCPICTHIKKQAYVSTPNYNYWNYN